MTEPDDLLHRELLVFVGKGGVGKTTASSAVALRLARRGRRTLLVSVDPAQRLPDALGVPISHRVTRVRGSLYALMLDAKRSLEEYLAERIPGVDLTKHPFYKYLSNYLPGLNELLAIGKLIEIREEKHFEALVIDTAPTGHALSFLTTPLKLSSLLRETLLLKWAGRGYDWYRKVAAKGQGLARALGGENLLPLPPDLDLERVLKQLADDVEAIRHLLSDPSRTTLLIVTLAEKLPVEETVQLHEYLTRELAITPKYLVVNRLQPAALDGLRRDLKRLAKDAESQRVAAEALAARGYDKGLLLSLLGAAKFDENRRTLHQERIGELERRLPRTPQIHLPLFPYDVQGLERLEELEDHFFKSIRHPAPAATPRTR